MKSLNLFRCFDSTIKWLAGVLTVLVLAACGGGGGDSPDLIAGHALPNALYSTAPASLTLTVGATQTFTVGGGTPLYKVSSSNPSVIVASVSGSNLTIRCVSEGSATITVFDQIGSSVSSSMTVGSGSIAVAATPFFATAPSTIKLAIGEVASFTLGGGTAPYFQSSSQAGVATGAIDAGKLIITGRATGSAEMSVFDSAGNTLKISVNVGNLTSVELYMTAPSTISLAPAAASSFTIGGGSAPYIVSSSNSAVASASIGANSTLVISANSAGTTQIVVFDSTGKSVSTALTVASATINTPLPLYVAAPGAVTLAVGATSRYGISGGTLPYTVSSSNASVVSASSASTTLTLTGVASGTAQVVVFDALGLSATVNVTAGSGSTIVTTTPFFATAPSTLTLAVGEVASFTLAGGTAPYFQSSSQAGVATAAISTTTLSITGKAAGAADVNVFDSAGNTLKISANVGSMASTALYMTAPSTISLVPAAASTFSIGGGSAPYTVSSSNASVATAIVNGTALVISAHVVGTAQIVVFDATGASVSTTLTAASNAATSTTALFVTTPTDVTIALGAAQTYSISGGTAPYTINSSNVAVATASGMANSFTITGIKVGAAQVFVFDAAGKSVAVNVTIGAGNVAMLPLSTTALSPTTIVVGTTVAFDVIGGTAPYAVTSDDPTIVTASVSGSTLNLTGVAVNTSLFLRSVVVRDFLGAKVTINVDVKPSGSNFFVSAPSDITISLKTYLYTVGNGSLPYTVSSSNENVATASITPANTLSITGINSGAAQVFIFDASGKSVTINVTVNSGASSAPTPLVVQPSASTANVGDILTFNLSGGSGSYSSVTVNNASIAAVGTSSGGTFSNSLSPLASTAFFAKLLNVGTTTVSIVDSQGQSTTLTLIVTARSSVLGLSPSALQVGENSVDPIVLNIYGGAGDYSAFTDDLQLSIVSITGTKALPTLTIGVRPGGNRCITPYDSAVEPRNYVANGIYNVTVTVVDSLGASATSVLSIKDSGNGVLDTGCP